MSIIDTIETKIAHLETLLAAPSETVLAWIDAEYRTEVAAELAERRETLAALRGVIVEYPAL